VENAAQTGASGDVRRNRFEPAFDAPVQAVVVAALVVRLMRFACDLAISSAAENRVSPTFRAWLRLTARITSSLA
jgi:hypothetical protein